MVAHVPYIALYLITPIILLYKIASRALKSGEQSRVIMVPRFLFFASGDFTFGM